MGWLVGKFPTGRCTNMGRVTALTRIIGPEGCLESTSGVRDTVTSFMSRSRNKNEIRQAGSEAIIPSDPDGRFGGRGSVLAEEEAGESKRSAFQTKGTPQDSKSGQQNNHRHDLQLHRRRYVELCKPMTGDIFTFSCNNFSFIVIYVVGNTKICIIVLLS